MLLQMISDSIIHDIVRTIITIVIEFDGPGVGHVYFATKDFKQHRPLYNVKTVSAIIIYSNGAVVAHAYFCKQFQIASIVHDNVGTISAIIIDFHGPGVEDTTLADDFEYHHP